MATTAKACGYAVDLLINKDKSEPQQAAAPVVTKSKGKSKDKSKNRSQARNAAQKAASKIASSVPSESKTPTYIMAIKDFISLAERIVGRQQPVAKVPFSFVKAIDRAIAVRQSYSKAVAGKDTRSDERHGFFVGVLEHVREVLRPIMASNVPQAARNDAHKENGPSNRFEGLDVEEPSEGFLNAPDVALPNQAAHYEIEQDTLDDALLVINLILEDYRKIETVVVENWEMYRGGECDLIAVSVMTNTAIDLARRLESDAALLLDKHGGWESVFHQHYSATCELRGENATFREQKADKMNFRMYEVEAVRLMPTYLILDTFLKA